MSEPLDVEIVKQESLLPKSEVRLGAWSMYAPQDAIKRGTELATALAAIINQQKLYAVITNKKGQKNKYVKCEGWTTMGAMLGVFPVEEYCRALPQGKGFEAKINLIRSGDGMIVGGASAECTHDEKKWKDNDSYSLRSMALTRATSKAFRLSFSWIIKLAGYEATPAEEMLGEEDASSVRQAVETEADRQASDHGKEPKQAKNGSQAPLEAPTTLFWTAPDKFNGHRAVFVNLKEFGSGLNEVAAEGLRQILKNYAKYGREDGDLWVPTGKKPHEMDALIAELEKCGVKTKRLAAP